MLDLSFLKKKESPVTESQPPAQNPGFFQRTLNRVTTSPFGRTVEAIKSATEEKSLNPIKTVAKQFGTEFKNIGNQKNQEALKYAGIFNKQRNNQPLDPEEIAYLKQDLEKTGQIALSFMGEAEAINKTTGRVLKKAFEKGVNLVDLGERIVKSGEKGAFKVTSPVSKVAPLIEEAKRIEAENVFLEKNAGKKIDGVTIPEGYKAYRRTVTGDTVDIKRLKTDPEYFKQAYESTFARGTKTDEKLYKTLTKELVPKDREASSYLSELYSKAKTPVSSATEQSSSLLEEAGKYKSAEEFVKDLTNTNLETEAPVIKNIYYHGDAYAAYGDTPHLEVRSGLSLTQDSTFAKQYASRTGDKGAIVRPFQLLPDTKILDASSGKAIEGLEMENLIKKARAEGYDAVKFKTTAPSGLGTGEELHVINPNSVKEITPADLTNIYNQAHGNKEVISGANPKGLAEKVAPGELDSLKLGTESNVSTTGESPHGDQVLQSDLGTLKPSLSQSQKDVKGPESFDFTQWKDPATFSLSRETTERNIENFAGKDAEAVKDFITNPVKENETAKTLFNNKLRQESKDLVVRDLGIRAGSKEDALIQEFGEGRITLDELKNKTPKWAEVEKASKFFRGKYDELLDLVNSARSKFGYDPIPKRPDYFRHFQEIGSVIDQFGLILKQDALPAEIAGLTDIFKPGKPFSSAELQRKGGPFTESAIKGFDNYIDSISRQIFHIDSVQRIRALEKSLRNAGAEGVANLPNITANISEYGNLVAGKKAKFDRAFESVFGRSIYGVLNTIKSRISGNLVGGNIASALTNFIPFTQSLATTSKPSFVRGLFESLISPLKQSYSEIAGETSGFLTRRFPEKYIDPTKLQKAGEFANWLFETVDKFTAKAIVSAKYFENVTKGLTSKEAMKVADEYAGKVMADRSIGQLPNLMGSKTLGIFTQFQTEVNNALSFMIHDIPKGAEGSKTKIVSAVAQLVVYSYLFNSMYEKVTGRRPTLDPLYVGLTAAGLSPAGEGKPLGTRLGVAGKDLAQNLPFVGTFTGGRIPLANVLPKDLSKKEILKSATSLIPPFGGGQLKKTIEGITSFNRGKETTAAGKLKYKIKQSGANAIRGSLFGKYSFPEAVQYYNHLGAKKTKNSFDFLK